MASVAVLRKQTGGPAELGDKQADTEGRSIFRTSTSRKDPNKIHRIQSLRGEGKYTHKHSQPSAENILRQYAEKKDKVWEPKPVQGKFGPAELGDRQEDTAGRVLFRHNPGAKALKAADEKENQASPHETDIKRALQDLSFLQRSSIFPGSVFTVPKRSVTQSMLEECRPYNTEFWVDKTHFPVKYDMKSFMEAEFSRRLLNKAMVKDLAAASS